MPHEYHAMKNQTEEQFVEIWEKVYKELNNMFSK